MEATTPPYEERPYTHFLLKPMFELFCISIHSKQINDDPKLSSLHDGKPCDIRGIVRVLDQDDNKFDFYNRKINNIETLNLGGFLSLNAFPIILSKPLLTVAVMLYDTAHDVEIANGVFEIDYCKMYDYDQLHVEKIDGQYGFASVYYSTFQHSMIASINKVVILHNNAGGDSLNDNLFGTIVARLERKYKTSNRDVHNEYEFPLVMLFDNQVKETKPNSTQAVLDLDNSIKLLRSYIVVPFNCSLRIEEDFCDNAGNKVVMNIQQNVYPASFNKNSVRYQNFEMQIQVTWFDCYDKFPWDIKVDETFDAKEDESQPDSSYHKFNNLLQSFVDANLVLQYQY